MKKSLLLLGSCLLASFVSAQIQPDQNLPLLTGVSNTAADQSDMLANTYRLLVTTGEKDPDGSPSYGGATAFRIHKNWFLTCAHGPFLEMNPSRRPVLPVGVAVQENKNPLGSAPFSLLVDMTATGEAANGRVYLFNPALRLTSSNTGRGEDLALVYVPDQDPSAPLRTASRELANLSEDLPDSPMADILAQMTQHLNTQQSQSASVWKRFLNHPIKPFHLLILSEKNLIDQLGAAEVTPYLFPLTAYFIHGVNQNGSKIGLVKFQFVPVGTHPGTDAIFYKRVTNLIPGTSGSPMTYGNYVVSVDSATNCSPMLTARFHQWLKQSMGSDYSPSLCVVAPEPPPTGSTISGGAVAAVGTARAPVDRNWNSGK